MLRNHYKILIAVTAILYACSNEAKQESVNGSVDNMKDNINFLQNESIKKYGSEKNIILYMTDAQDTGQIISNKENAKYFRILLEVKGDKYLVQDFYISGIKQTDPYWLINGKKEYVFNETVSQSYYPRDSERVIWYESGKKMAETNYARSKENGQWTSWYESGHIKDKMFYIDGQLNGKVQNWNENGGLIGECEYKMGVQNGHCYEKYTNNPNVLIYDGNYENGNKIGIWKEWDESGNLVKEQNFN